jgi:hypothetical protein
VKTIQSTAGDSRECRLVVRNVTGIAEECGFRLYWQDIAEPNIICPALGLVTSNPFRTEREAIAFGERSFGERAKRIRP